MPTGLKRVRRRQPNALSAAINQYLQDHNLTYKQLAELSDATAQRLGVGEGINYNVIGLLARGESRDPQIRNLWILGLTMGRTLGDMLMLMGYDPSALQTTPSSEEAERVRAMLGAAIPADVERVRRVLGLDSDGRTMIDTFLDAAEARK